MNNYYYFNVMTAPKMKPLPYHPLHQPLVYYTDECPVKHDSV